MSPPGVTLDAAPSLALAGFLAWVLLSAALHKLRHPRAFQRALDDYRLLPAALVGPVGRALGWVELAAGLGVLAPPARTAGALLAAALFALYGGAIAVNLARGRRRIDCGCGGPGARRELSEGLVLRNAGLVLAALLAALPETPRAWLWLDTVTALGGATVLVLLYVTLDGVLARAPELARGGR
ncbi:MAG: MauE/DoxX family redox-associated membrane protein [Myxococcota bacterium]|nr:MauE/DoxX family redox-associated membrane protein [Myxococcota bacterium]